MSGRHSKNNLNSATVNASALFSFFKHPGDAVSMSKWARRTRWLSFHSQENKLKIGQRRLQRVKWTPSLVIGKSNFATHSAIGMEILVMANFSRFLLLFLYECRPSDW
jgi:hypothetical protein